MKKNHEQNFFIDFLYHSPGWCSACKHRSCKKYLEIFWKLLWFYKYFMLPLMPPSCPPNPPCEVVCVSQSVAGSILCYVQWHLPIRLWSLSDDHHQSCDFIHFLFWHFILSLFFLISDFDFPFSHLQPSWPGTWCPRVWPDHRGKHCSDLFWVKQVIILIEALSDFSQSIK